MEAQRKVMVDAITPLAALPEFEKFIETVKQMKDYTVESTVHTTTVCSEKETAAHVGEIRAYLWFIETARAQKEQLEAQAKAAQEQGH